MFASVIGCARDTVTLSTLYFVPDATIIEALCAAAQRGVTVTVIFRKTKDSWIGASAVDRTAELLGSSKLDVRSFDKNYENNILFQHETLTTDIRNRQGDYIIQSDTFALHGVLNWRLYGRIWNNLVATIGPVL